jgi:hypothetical protein
VFQDGTYFLQVVQSEEAKLRTLCQRAEHDLEATTLPDDGKFSRSIYINNHVIGDSLAVVWFSLNLLVQLILNALRHDVSYFFFLKFTYC